GRSWKALEWRVKTSPRKPTTTAPAAASAWRALICWERSGLRSSGAEPAAAAFCLVVLLVSDMTVPFCSVTVRCEVEGWERGPDRHLCPRSRRGVRHWEAPAPRRGAAG